jgi:hypothetical protein
VNICFLVVGVDVVQEDRASDMRFTQFNRAGRGYEFNVQGDARRYARGLEGVSCYNNVWLCRHRTRIFFACLYKDRG